VSDQDFLPAPAENTVLNREDAPRIHFDGSKNSAMETGRNRLLVTGMVVLLAFTVVGGRLITLATSSPDTDKKIARATAKPNAVGRGKIVDRRGVILAASLPIASLYANPQGILDADEAADKLAEILPDLSREELLVKLRGKGQFVWLRRNLTPQQVYDINALGVPGVAFADSERRVFPHGRVASHLLGMTDVDGKGIAGVERYFDDTLSNDGGRVQLSIDLRIQAILHQELTSVVARFNALGAAGVILDAQTGEVTAMVSLPDFNPNDVGTLHGEAGFNRVTKGVYEMGSTFKLLTAAMALDSGKVLLQDRYDARKPIRIARFRISDFYGKNRWLSVPEILIYSSNIGAAKMAMDLGGKAQKAYLTKLGLLRQSTVELPEVGTPLSPARWRDINTMTISYGHGIAVTPLQMAAAIATVVNGGYYRPPTILKKDKPKPGAEIIRQIFSEKTSGQMRNLMRLVVSRGTGKKANVPGYRIGGKTGTAEKQGNGGYRKKALISSFVAAFPIDAPRYVLLVLVDEPKGNKSTYYSATGGWVAAPTIANLVRRIAPMIGIRPVLEGDKPKTGKSKISKRRRAPVKAAFVPSSRKFVERARERSGAH
jgi:cell division protein FtsI (penicillin-binding protein 3)